MGQQLLPEHVPPEEGFADGDPTEKPLIFFSTFVFPH
jgi:hypothetical protein